MLAPKKVKSTREIILIALMIVSLGVSAYLIFVMVGYFSNKNQELNLSDQMMINQSLDIGEKQLSGDWNFLGSGVDIFDKIRSSHLRTDVLEVDLEGLKIGRPNIFDSFVSPITNDNL
jgi:hypothetical protein